MSKHKSFDLVKTLEAKAASDAGFKAMVDAEVAALDLEQTIVALRKRHRLTQAQVAQRMGVTQSAIAQFEQKGAAAKMEMRTLVKMVAAAGGALSIRVKPAKSLRARPVKKHASGASR